MANTINLDLLTERERVIWERNRRVATSDVLTLLESLCAARQAARDALGDLNAACNASEEVNHAGLVAVAILRLERAVTGNAAPVVCDWLRCGAPPVAICCLCDDLLCDVHRNTDADGDAVCLGSCTPVATVAAPQINTEPVS